jgi:predicted negative regulator of RcsB-dependent stress response
MVVERAKRFWQRHRRGLFITAAVAGAGYLAYSYLRQKVKEVTEATSSERNDQEKYLPRDEANESSEEIHPESAGLHVQCPCPLSEHGTADP